MSKISVIIPTRKEPYLLKTIKELYDNAAGEIEVLVVLDGEQQQYKIPRRKGLRTLRNKSVIGLRNCVNAAAEVATGKYLMKLDAHCRLGEGWDEILKADCADNWIVIPRRYWLDAPTWTIIKSRPINGVPMTHIDAMSYLYPFLRPYRPRVTCRPDNWRQAKIKDNTIVEDMGFQGSLWLLHAEHFKRIGGMAQHGYGTFGEEPVEIGLKTQLGPWEGAVMRNNKTWYAHWAKPQSHWAADPEEAGRVTDAEREKSYAFAFDFWWYNRWDEQIHDFQWLVDKFWPLPKWPDDWRWLIKEYNRYEYKPWAQ